MALQTPVQQQQQEEEEQSTELSSSSSSHTHTAAAAGGVTVCVFIAHTHGHTHTHTHTDTYRVFDSIKVSFQLLVDIHFLSGIKREKAEAAGHVDLFQTSLKAANGA